MRKLSGQAELIGVLGLIAVIGLTLILVYNAYQPAGEFKLPAAKPACTQEICDGRDNDCDRLVDEGTICAEGYECFQRMHKQYMH